jgi:hypothetical protein
VRAVKALNYEVEAIERGVIQPHIDAFKRFRVDGIDEGKKKMSQENLYKSMS